MRRSACDVGNRAKISVEKGAPVAVLSVNSTGKKDSSISVLPARL